MNNQLQMIGTGSAFAKKYFNNSALVYAQNRTLLIDCGITAPTALYQLDKPINEIDGVLITHLHGDHIGGLEEFGFQSNFIYNRKPDLFVPSVLIEPLWEHSLKAGMIDSNHSKLEDYFNVVPLEERSPKEFYPGLQVEIIQTEHVKGKASFSLVMNDSLFYSSDCTFHPTLIVEEMFHKRQCSVFLHDCQLFNPPAVHTSLEQLLTLPEEVQERMYLMHYGDDMEQFIGKTGKMRFIEQQKLYQF